MRIRHSFSDSQRREAWERCGHACALCGNILRAFDLHHVHFFSLGGSDDEGNLILLCPNCHRQIPHRLYMHHERDVLETAAQRWYNFVQAEAKIVGLSRRGPEYAAELLIDGGLRETILAQGAHRRMQALANRVLGTFPVSNAGNQALRLELMSLSADMAIYSGGAQRATEAVADALARMDPSQEFQHSKNASTLVLARLHREAGSIAAERKALDKFEADHASREQLDEWLFRSVSYELYFGSPESLLSIEFDRGTSGSLLSRMAGVNIDADRGRAYLQEDLEMGYKALVDAFMVARSILFRRNMFVTALKLAEVSLLMGESWRAAEWWAVSSHLHSIGTARELSLEEVRLSIIDRFGEAVLTSAKGDAGSIMRLIST